MTTSQSARATSQPLPGHDLGKGFWRLADPKISLASMASIFLGACVAAAHGPLHYGWLAVTILGIFAIEVAKNASGEIFDFDSGADLAVAPSDRSPFSGGKRVLVDGLLTHRETAVISLIAYLIGVGAALLIVAEREPKVLWIGVAGVVCAYLYQAPPLKLSYRGWGRTRGRALLRTAYCRRNFSCSTRPRHLGCLTRLDRARIAHRCVPLDLRISRLHCRQGCWETHAGCPARSTKG